jgi:hypothetical protein
VLPISVSSPDTGISRVKGIGYEVVPIGNREATTSANRKGLEGEALKLELCKNMSEEDLKEKNSELEERL